MEQLEFKFPEPSVYRVGVRVYGEKETQVYDITAMDYRQARNSVKDAVEGVEVILTRVK